MFEIMIGGSPPDFQLPSPGNKTFGLSDFHGKRHVVLAFYPFDWSPGWTNEMPALEARLKEFESADATILGISCDSIYSHDAWGRHHGLSYPLLSDIHRTVCQAYGVHNVERNCAKRSVFIIDKHGILRFKEEYGPGQLPDPERLLQVVRGFGK